MGENESLHNSSVKGSSLGELYKRGGLPGQESGGVIARALEPEYLK